MTVRYYIEASPSGEECLWKDTGARDPVMVMDSYRLDPELWEGMRSWVLARTLPVDDLEVLTGLLIEPVRTSHEATCPAFERGTKTPLSDCDCWRRDLAREMAKRVLDSPWAMRRLAPK